MIFCAQYLCHSTVGLLGITLISSQNIPHQINNVFGRGEEIHQNHSASGFSRRQLNTKYFLVPFVAELPVVQASRDGSPPPSPPRAQTQEMPLATCVLSLSCVSTTQLANVHSCLWMVVGWRHVHLTYCSDLVLGGDKH